MWKICLEQLVAEQLSVKIAQIFCISVNIIDFKHLTLDFCACRLPVDVCHSNA